MWRASSTWPKCTFNIAHVEKAGKFVVMSELLYKLDDPDKTIVSQLRNLSADTSAVFVAPFLRSSGLLRSRARSSFAGCVCVMARLWANGTESPRSQLQHLFHWSIAIRTMRQWTIWPFGPAGPLDIYSQISDKLSKVQVS